MKLALTFLTAASVGFVGCGSPQQVPIPDPDAPISPGVDAHVPAGWTKLISRNWEVSPGSLDSYRCRRIQVPADMWISGFRALNPPGTHHELLTITDGMPTVMGDYNCGFDNLDTKMLYAAGLGTDDYMFPAGVAVKLAKDSYININLHLFNASEVTTTGESGVLVKEITEAEVQKEVDMVFAGTTNLTIPADSTNHTYVGGCNVPTSWEVFSLWAHMHEIANHMKIEVTPVGTTMPEVIHDADYTFEDQKFYPITAHAVPEGARIRVTCRYNNNTGTPVGFGDSSNSEMCFAGLYKYPAGGNLFDCVDR